MDGMNLHFPANKTTAIVDPSGSGKSTIVGLLKRFFEPAGGKISVLLGSSGLRICPLLTCL